MNRQLEVEDEDISVNLCFAIQLFSVLLCMRLHNVKEKQDIKQAKLVDSSLLGIEMENEESMPKVVNIY